MEKTILINARMIVENGIKENGYLTINREKIDELGTMENCPNLGDYHSIIDCKELEWVLPGMIDIHIHGVGGSDVMDGTVEALETMTNLLPREGTTSFLATTMTNPTENIENALKNTAKYMENHNFPGQAEILGVHLEGPFINKEQKGAQPEKDIIPPDVQLLKRWQNISNDSIRIVTLAPELDTDHKVIEYLREMGIIASMGHTNATYEEVKEAVSAGLSQATHLFNGMNRLHHREPGAAGAALLLDELAVEIIPDGVHIHPELMKLIYRVKGPENILLITDAMRAKCLKNGIYDLGGQKIELKDGKALLPATGSLAGSVLKLHEGRRNIEEWLGLGAEELVLITSTNPAKRLGIFDRKGSIAQGKDADLILLNESGEVITTFCRGKIAWSKDQSSDCHDSFGPLL